MTKRFTTKLLKNKEMNDKTYQLRRQVIGFIYEAKKLVPGLPRIEVRVTDNSPTGIRGCANMANGQDRIIWMTENFVGSRVTTFHEILHTVYNIDHVKGCRLMGPSSDQTLTKDEVNKLFLKYVNQATAKKA